MRALPRSASASLGEKTETNYIHTRITFSYSHSSNQVPVVGWHKLQQPSIKGWRQQVSSRLFTSSRSSSLFSKLWLATRKHTSPQNLGKYVRHLETFFTPDLLDFLTQFMSQLGLVLVVVVPPPSYAHLRPSQNFLQQSLTERTTQSTMHLGGAVTFCLQKTNHATELTTSGNSNSVKGPRLLCRYSCTTEQN